MYSKTTTVKNISGLHARPASDFVLKAKEFESKVFVKNLNVPDSLPVNAKSIMRLLAEGIVKDTSIEISAEGADERAAVEELAALVEAGFGE
ncbi:MAG: HPr family phosphocarrier protein [Clostridia bacterium]|nr:HPr family phosphocarrier protein [Clostridia bacterium]